MKNIRLLGIRAMAIAWLMSGGLAFGQIASLPIGDRATALEYSAKQGQTVTFAIGPLWDNVSTEPDITPEYTFEYSPTNMADLVAWSRAKLHAILYDPSEPYHQDAQTLFNEYGTNEMVVWAATATETVYQIGGSGVGVGFGYTPLFSGTITEDTNRVTYFPSNLTFFLHQDGTNWVAPPDLETNLSFPFLGADDPGFWSMFIRVPRITAARVDVPSSFAGTNTFYQDQKNLVYGVGTSSVGGWMALDGQVLFGTTPGTVYVWLTDTNGMPLVQTFDLGTGALLATDRVLAMGSPSLLPAKPEGPLSSIPGQQVGIPFTGTPGQTVNVEQSTNLVDWSPAGTAVLGTNGVGTFTATASGSCFWRGSYPVPSHPLWISTPWIGQDYNGGQYVFIAFWGNPGSAVQVSYTIDGGATWHVFGTTTLDSEGVGNIQGPAPWANTAKPLFKEGYGG